MDVSWPEAHRGSRADAQMLDNYHDDVCRRLRERMVQAAEKDKRANDAKMPATAKLAMLEEAMGVLRK